MIFCTSMLKKRNLLIKYNCQTYLIFIRFLSYGKMQMEQLILTYDDIPLFIPLLSVCGDSSNRQVNARHFLPVYFIIISIILIVLILMNILNSVGNNVSMQSRSARDFEQN